MNLSVTALSSLRYQPLKSPSPRPASPLESILPSPLLVVEDEPAMQLRLRSILTALGYTDEALSFSGSIAEAHALLADQPFAMALIDVGLPDGNGIDLIRSLHAADPALPILVISTWSTEQIIVSALQAGATGYMLKDRDDMEIGFSIRSALRGGAPIDPFVAKRILQLMDAEAPGPAGQNNGPPPGPPSSPLSPRETEILGLVSKGLTNLEISEILSLSRLTVECHIKNIYKKLAVKSRTEALFEARASGLLQ
ncbi:DNA-binding response regulator [Noviherbaspirillum cavernae]|uniref:DNA-binding response regulator n=2 Tax=Noviherbaspirillum cavernae TaxID=2320862 RepID=A0A418WYP4_9BURK|nr:response regulator transcription factor [Noviherbaspirillum cavernae]RJG05291.1 DNA-binding response regulator [Noviherbaspirillum cavernae]